MVNGSPFFLTVFLKGVCGVCAECERERIALVPLFLIKLDLKILRTKRVNPNCCRILVVEFILMWRREVKFSYSLFFKSVKLYPSHFFIFPSLISSRYSIRNEVDGGPRQSPSNRKIFFFFSNNATKIYDFYSRFKFYFLRFRSD